MSFVKVSIYNLYDNNNNNLEKTLKSTENDFRAQLCLQHCSGLLE